MSYVIYEKKVERDLTENLFSKYEFKKRGATSPESEIRESMAKLLNTTIPIICGRTRGWTLEEMTRIYLTASKWRTNPKALLQKLIKEHNLKIKEQLLKESSKNK